MTVRLAKSAGFCFGVSRAINMVYRLIENGEKVFTLGPIIHNPQMVEELSEKGVKIIESPEDAPAGATVVVRSHGVPKEIYERLDARHIKYADATCPFVAKIHRIVRENTADGSPALIAGNPEHPEVRGIKSFCCGPAYIFNSLEELKNIAGENRLDRQKRIIAVSQTTFPVDEWRNCAKFIKKVYTNSIIFDTICDATSIRQQEAKEISKSSDLMIVIGGKQSSNTAKLHAVCSEYCRSLLIEDASELPLDEFKNHGVIGVTAGASTPARLIKEVLRKMADVNVNDNDNDNSENNQATEEFSFAEAIEKSLKSINTGDKVKGTVVGFSANEVQIDIGTKHAGFVPLSEFSDDSSADPKSNLKVGDEIDLIVLKINDVDGTVMLSKKRVDSIKGWEDIETAYDNGTVLEGTVVEVVKGGLLVMSNGSKLFVPASQSGVSKNDNLETLLHQKVKFKIIDINTKRKRAVGSISAVLREERKALAEKFWEEVEIGKEYTGTVKSLTSYGAFVDLGGVDGMVHVSELSWQRIKHPSEVVKVGDLITVKVKDFDKEAKRVSLTYKKESDNPWKIFLEKFKVGDVIDVKIVNFMPFGAFAQIIPGVDGLIHISQIADTHIVKPQDVLTIGQEVKVKIINIEEEKKRISLSIREAEGSETTVEAAGETSGEVSTEASETASASDEPNTEQPETENN